MKNHYIFSLLFIIILLGAVFLQSCFKKGDEDPFVSLKSREARLNGNWEVSKYTISGKDILNNESKYSSYSYSCGDYNGTYKSHMLLEFDFRKNGSVKLFAKQNTTTIYDYINNYCNDKTESDSEVVALLWKWDFLHGNSSKKNKEQLVLHADGYSDDIYPLVYDVHKLSNSEMKWETVYDNELIEMEFKKKK